jgi:hypothetical protein
MFVVLVVVFGFTGNIFASEGVLEGLGLDIEASATLDFYSQYIWRGFALDTDPVIQPGFSLSGYGFTLSWWGSMDVDNNDNLNSDESDTTIDYTKGFDDFSISLGHTYYDFPGTNSYSREFYAGLGLSNVPLSPALTYYHDYGDENNGGGKGNYLVLDLSHSFSLIDDPEISLDLGAHVAYNDKLFIAGEGGDYLLSAGLTVPLTKSLTFAPSINYAIPYGDVKDLNDGNQKDRFYAGFSLGYTF